MIRVKCLWPLSNFHAITTDHISVVSNKHMVQFITYSELVNSLFNLTHIDTKRTIWLVYVWSGNFTKKIRYLLIKVIKTIKYYYEIFYILYLIFYPLLFGTWTTVYQLFWDPKGMSNVASYLALMICGLLSQVKVHIVTSEAQFWKQ